MSSELYDIAILGGGPGGYVAALYAGAKGARVALVERDRVGGTCVTVGCIPSKALLDSSHAFSLAADGEVFGVRTRSQEFDQAQAVKRKDAVVKQLVSGIETLLKARKVDLIKAEGALLGPGRVVTKAADGATREVRARSVIVATGSGPTQPPIPGLAEAHPLNNEGVLALETAPKRAVIIGGGIIGMEFATFFAETGSTVTVVEMLPNVLAPYDQELVRILLRVLEKKGVQVVTNARITGVAPGMQRGTYDVTAEVGGETKSFAGDAIVVATGRKPLLDRVKDANLRANTKGIEIDEHLRTNAEGVYAVGDCAAKPAAPLAHVAFMEGEVAVDNILGRARRMDYAAVPEVIYTHPEIAVVGLSEAQARERYGRARLGGGSEAHADARASQGSPSEPGDDVKVSKVRFGASGRALALGAPEGMVKLVTVGPERLVVGIHIVGPQASELVAEATLAIRLEATAEDLVETIHAHPTLAETLREAALSAVGTPIHTA